MGRCVPCRGTVQPQGRKPCSLPALQRGDPKGLFLGTWTWDFLLLKSASHQRADNQRDVTPHHLGDHGSSESICQRSHCLSSFPQKANNFHAVGVDSDPNVFVALLSSPQSHARGQSDTNADSTTHRALPTLTTSAPSSPAFPRWVSLPHMPRFNHRGDYC